MKNIIILLFISILTIFLTYNKDYVEIPASSIRIRIIASSDSIEDQNNKRIVKSAVEDKIYSLISDKKKYSEVDNVLMYNTEIIDTYIKNVLEKNDIKESFISNYGYNYFPEKTYKNVTYEAGLYKSFVVTLGEGKGENWWCVLYPPLCLIDENSKEYEYRSLINEVINKYN